MEQTQTKQQQAQTIDAVVQQYLSEMTALERQGYEIARSHLNTSFNIVKSNGFVEWLKKK
jgi:predicted secreted acid phosphatase